jgi:hypothetical protein
MRCTLQQPISPKAAVGVKLASSTHDAVSPLYTRVTHVCPKWAWCLARGCSVGHAKGCASSEWLAGGFSRSSGLIRSGCHCATCFRLILAAAKQAKCARRHGNLAAQIICTGARRSVIAQPDSHRRPLTARPSVICGCCMALVCSCPLSQAASVVWRCAGSSPTAAQASARARGEERCRWRLSCCPAAHLQHPM